MIDKTTPAPYPRRYGVAISQGGVAVNCSTESRRRSRWRGLLVFVVAAAAASACIAAFAAAPGLASCNENGSLFWDDHTVGFSSTGTRQSLVVRAHSNIGTGCETNGIVAGGTAHMSPQNGGGSLVELGWRDLTDSSGNHYYRLFTEGCIFSGCSVNQYSSGCASNGTTVTMYVKNSSVGSYNWNYFYACNGGGYSSLGSTNGESFNRASPRVETFRFGSDSGKFILDYHNDLQHWDQYGNLYRQFGHMTCVLGMSATYGVPNADPATAWQTATSGVTC